MQEELWKFQSSSAFVGILITWILKQKLGSLSVVKSPSVGMRGCNPAEINSQVCPCLRNGSSPKNTLERSRVTGPMLKWKEERPPSSKGSQNESRISLFMVHPKPAKCLCSFDGDWLSNEHHHSIFHVERMGNNSSEAPSLEWSLSSAQRFVSRMEYHS